MRQCAAVKTGQPRMCGSPAEKGPGGRRGMGGAGNKGGIVVNGREQGDRAARVREAASRMMHLHYVENDVEGLLGYFDDRFGWIGTAEQEYALGAETVRGIFRQFVGKVPRCILSEEQYDVLPLAPDVDLCIGRLWIATDPATGSCLRVHQRLTFIFRWVEGAPRCCHIHISNPYSEMTEQDVGFPQGMAQQSADYLHEQLELQKKQLIAQTAELRSIYNTVPCGILRLRRRADRYELLTFNRALCRLLGSTREEIERADWSRGFLGEVLAEDTPALARSIESLTLPGDRSELDYCMHNRSGGLSYLHCCNTLISADGEGEVIQRIIFDISERVRIENSLRRLSFEDSLTGLYNRNKFNLLTDLYQKTPPARLGVASLDLNGLKEINDRMGHAAGDGLLARTALHIARSFPGQAYRVGGDEFIILDERSDEIFFRRAIESLHASMQRDGISVAIGVSWRGERCDITEQLIEADRRMYHVKAQHYANA